MPTSLMIMRNVKVCLSREISLKFSGLSFAGELTFSVLNYHCNRSVQACLFVVCPTFPTVSVTNDMLRRSGTNSNDSYVET